jgi:hypothetical protein
VRAARGVTRRSASHRSEVSATSHATPAATLSLGTAVDAELDSRQSFWTQLTNFSIGVENNICDFFRPGLVAFEYANETSTFANPAGMVPTVESVVPRWQAESKEMSQIPGVWARNVVYECRVNTEEEPYLRCRKNRNVAF